MVKKRRRGRVEMTDREKKQGEVEANYKAFRKALPDIIESNRGKLALMRAGEIVDYFDSLSDALKYATKLYPDGLYSVQEVTDSVVDLGWYSRVAVHAAV